MVSLLAFFTLISMEPFSVNFTALLARFSSIKEIFFESPSSTLGMLLSISVLKRKLFSWQRGSIVAATSCIIVSKLKGRLLISKSLSSSFE